MCAIFIGSYRTKYEFNCHYWLRFALSIVDLRFGLAILIRLITISRGYLPAIGQLVGPRLLLLIPCLMQGGELIARTSPTDMFFIAIAGGIAVVLVMKKKQTSS